MPYYIIALLHTTLSQEYTVEQDVWTVVALTPNTVVFPNLQSQFIRKLVVAHIPECTLDM